MAQKILIRRGGIDNLSASIGVSKGELIYASGSLNGVENVVFIANADGNNTFTPVNKLYTGTAAPNSFNAALNGTPYYKSDSQALYILNNAGSTALDLSGNLEGTQISSITASGSFSGSFQGNGSGLTNLTLSSIVAPGNDTEVLFNNGGAIAASSNLKITGSSLDAAALNIVTTGNVTASNLQLSGNADITGNIVLGGSITIGDQTTDNIQVGGELTSDLIPDADSTYNLGSNLKRWLNIYVDNVSGSTADFSGGVSTLGYITAGGVLDVAGAGTIGNGLTVTGSGTFTSTVTAVTGISSSGWLYAGGNLDVDGTSTLTGNTSVGGTLEVTTGISSSGWLYAAGNLDIDGTSTLTGNTSVGGTLTVTGQTDLNGNVVLGDAATDTVAFKADVSSSIIPSANATFNIGASSDKWLNGYFVSASIDSLTIGGIDPTAQDLDDVMANGNSTDSDFILNNNGNQTITHTGATGNLTISSDNGDVYVEGTRFTGNDMIIAGNLTVAGTQTIVNSTTVEIGDNIVVLNAAGIAADGGIIVRDAVGAQTASGSLLWNATDDYWYAGTSGSTQYRLVQFAAGTGVTDNYLPKSANDGSKHLTNSIISDDGTTATIHGNISGSLLQVNIGIEASGLTGIIDTSSRAIFRDGSNRLGALATTDSAIEVSTLIGYKADGTFVATSVIDGGTF
jgi:hypothetical protein